MPHLACDGLRLQRWPRDKRRVETERKRRRDCHITPWERRCGALGKKKLSLRIAAGAPPLRRSPPHHLGSVAPEFTAVDDVDVEGEQVLEAARKYDPRRGMSKEVFDWRCCQHDKVSNRMPEVMRKMRILTQKMHSNFLDDPRRPQKVGCHLILYKDLMKRTARLKTHFSMLAVGFGKFKKATKNKSFRARAIIVERAAAGFAVRLGVSWMQQKT
ncbi:hypothetical protein EJB05_37307, partial [Eragrostis curvula]